MAEKKFSKTIVNPETGREKTVKYGAKGYRIAPGTDKGDRYCARSWGQMLKHPEAAKDPNSPLRLSRAKWDCIACKFSGACQCEHAATGMLFRSIGRSLLYRKHQWILQSSAGKF